MTAKGPRPPTASRAVARLVGVTLLVAAACSIAPTATGWAGGGSRWPDVPLVAARRPSPACRPGAPLARPGVTVRHLRSGGYQRTYRLAVPVGAGPERPAPLVLLLHGLTSTAEAVAARSGMEAAGVAAGAVVVTPQGLGRPTRWSLPGVLPGPDDVAFAGDLLDRVAATVCVDPGRVVVAGFSNGAAFAAVLGCSMGGRLAGLALVAGANLEAGCRWPAALPVVAFHGSADGVVPLAGGPVLHGLLLTRPVAAAMADWAARDGCRPSPGRSEVAPGVVRSRWGGCDHPAGVSLYVVDGWDHRWPPRATEIVLRTFGIT